MTEPDQRSQVAIFVSGTAAPVGMLARRMR
jgi:hypothetical protein